MHFPLFASVVLPTFVVWVGVTAVVLAFLLHRTRSEQFWMSIGGAVSGPIAAYLYQDFFHPTVSSWWHAGFGGFFLGMIAALALQSTRSSLTPEGRPTVSISGKVSLTLMAALIGLILWFVTNAVLATAIAFAAAALGIVVRRNDLKELVLAGALSALVLYGGLIRIFFFGCPM